MPVVVGRLTAVWMPRMGSRLIEAGQSLEKTRRAPTFSKLHQAKEWGRRSGPMAWV